jgi:hypothetical protein
MRMALVRIAMAIATLLETTQSRRIKFSTQKARSVYLKLSMTKIVTTGESKTMAILTALPAIATKVTTATSISVRRTTMIMMREGSIRRNAAFRMVAKVAMMATQRLTGEPVFHFQQHPHLQDQL